MGTRTIWKCSNPNCKHTRRRKPKGQKLECPACSRRTADEGHIAGTMCQVVIDEGKRGQSGSRRFSKKFA